MTNSYASLPFLSQVKAEAQKRGLALPAARPTAASRPQTDAELADYLWRSFGIKIPDAQVCPNHSTPFRAFADAYFARSSVAVWKASRGFGGKSFLMSLLGNAEAATLGADVTILGGSGEQSARVLEYLQRWAGEETNTKRRTDYSSGGRVSALMASSKSVRGPHPQRLRIDEADEVDLPILDAAMGQPMGTDRIAKQTVFSSTHQYPDGTMTEILKRAGDKSWPVYEWCWKETSQPHGWLSLEEIESKRSEVPASMWAAEYDLQEPSPEGRAIQPDKVEAYFDRALGQFDGRLGEYIEIEPPDPAGQYATGADWAKEKDYTIIDTLRIDTRPMRRVAWERRGREAWPAMIARFDARIARFGGGAAHDKTGIGGVVDDYRSQTATGYNLVGLVRHDMFAKYIAAIENGDIVSPLIQYCEREHRYCSMGDLTGAGHPPDSFVAGAMAFRAASSELGFGFGVT